MQRLLRAGFVGLWRVVALAASFVLLLNSLEPRFYQKLVYPLIKSLRKGRGPLAAERVSSGRPSSKKSRVGCWFDRKRRRMIRLLGIFSRLEAGPTRGF